MFYYRRPVALIKSIFSYHFYNGHTAEVAFCRHIPSNEKIPMLDWDFRDSQFPGRLR